MSFPLSRRIAPRRGARTCRPPGGWRRIALRLAFWPGFWLACGLWALPTAAAVADPSDLCDRAAVEAARATGVPLAVLQAIALTESGRSRAGRVRPWPWATNQGGPGHWFESRAAAEAHVAGLIAEGRRNIDIGCFQINLRWHGHAFASPEAMFEPAANARYAAEFLSGLAAELGSWEAAAGAYHSRTPELAERYGARFRQHLAALEADPPGPLPGPVRAGRGPPSPYPLLAAGDPAGMGSLVPLGGSRGTLLMPAAQPLR